MSNMNVRRVNDQNITLLKKDEYWWKKTLLSRSKMIHTHMIILLRTALLCTGLFSNIKYPNSQISTVLVCVKYFTHTYFKKRKLILNLFYTNLANIINKWRFTFWSRNKIASLFIHLFFCHNRNNNVFIWTIHLKTPFIFSFPSPVLTYFPFLPPPLFLRCHANPYQQKAPAHHCFHNDMNPSCSSFCPTFL